MPFPSLTTLPNIGLFPGIGDAPTFLFTPPGITQVPSGTDRLWFRFKTDRSLSVLKSGSSYTEVDTPDSEDVEAADAAYIGGRSYVVSYTEALALTAAGFGAGISIP